MTPLGVENPADPPLRSATVSRRLSTRLGDGQHTFVLLAVLIGVGAGLGAVGFRYLIEGFTWLFTGDLTLGRNPHPTSPLYPGIGIGAIVVAPVLGGLLYGPLVSRFAPEARGHGVPEVMLAVARHGGRIRPRVAVVKSLASALCIGSGGSVGREGPIVQIGSALGSAIGQFSRYPERRVRLLVACGAAGGIAATFNAPIAGVFFALEVILRDFAADSVAVVVLSSVTAAAIGRLAFGSEAFLQLPHFHLHSGIEYALFVGLGLLAAIVGVLFTRVLYGGEDVADRVWRGPQWARPAAGGIVLGLLLLLLPQMYGVGYPVLESAVRGHYALGFLGLLLAGKILATSITIAIGGSGGVFAPSLFMGAMLGSGYGQAIHKLIPGLTLSPGAYGLVGMAAVFGAAARAPVTAVLIIFELTGDYPVILPLMVSVAVAAGVAGLLSHDSIYTLKLRRRGIDLDRPAGPMHAIALGQAMRPVPVSVAPDASVAHMIGRLADGAEDALPVVTDSGELIGVISADDLDAALRDPDGARSASDLARPVPELQADRPLDSGARALADSEEPGLPVVAGPGGKIVGWITHRDVLRAYRGAGPPAGTPPSEGEHGAGA